ncbi:hypothetical protein Airi02_069450 [Actinoallomurus iriomotensis]|uniref:Uncharacterized protein n=1 Tax=Actinoallomurus iriomotensis TaxID=478107 RepID=A0A9W6W4H8_9ACTN|nr:hypothetical protein [Actinoallomurus iriomotensis]GLY89016.1 hypothetical protein Airi02_069450 [Actinoallomurus iriomotensis]
MPILRRHGLIRDDRPLAGQAYALHAVLTGFGTTMSDPATAPLHVDDSTSRSASAVRMPYASATRPSSGATIPPTDTARPRVTPLAVPIRPGRYSWPSVVCTANGTYRPRPSTNAAANATAGSGANSRPSRPGTVRT